VAVLKAVVCRVGTVCLRDGWVDEMAEARGLAERTPPDLFCSRNIRRMRRHACTFPS
jgi:hypothetical protein